MPQPTPVSRPQTAAAVGEAVEVQALAVYAVPRRADGRSWAGRTVIVEERLDGSLWVAADGLHQRLVKAPSVAPLLRARKLDRIEDLLPAAELPAISSTVPPAVSVVERPLHPWRRYPAVRPR